MNNRLKVIVLSFFCLTASKGLAIDLLLREFADLISETEQSFANTRRQAMQLLKSNHANIGSFETFQIDLAEEGSTVKVALKLPKIQPDVAAKINVDAKGNLLEAVVSCEQGTVKLTIADGLVLRARYNIDTKTQNHDTAGKDVYKHFNTVTMQSLLLPARVNNLENSKAEFKDGTLFLLLPKENDGSVKSGWKRIEIK